MADAELLLGVVTSRVSENVFAQPPVIVLLENGSVAREGELGIDRFADARARVLPTEPEERLHLARRAVADRCLYGVDVNPMAVEMAKLSLWLITVDRERPFTFLDHALRCGDSLLGISRIKQLENFSLRDEDDPQLLFATANIWRHVDKAIELRRKLAALPSNTDAHIREKQRLHEEAETLLQKLRATADFLVAAELDCPTERGWKTRRALAAERMQVAWQKGLPEFQQLAAVELNGHRTFHWPLEFPEVFAPVSNAGHPPTDEAIRGFVLGFDAIAGNPPFLGGQKITGGLSTPYRDYLVHRLAGGQRGSADLCAYFFLRAHWQKHPRHGMAGLVATNTIAQGDTREVGLEQLVAAGAIIPRAIPSRPWPGVAALEVAHVWLRRGEWNGEFILDDKPVSGITAFLTEPGRASGKPFRLAANAGKSFQGSIVLGMGFVLTPEQAQALLARNERNRAVLFPYLNGEDLNSRPDQSPSRWVINFHDWPLERTVDGSWYNATEKQCEAWLRSGRVPSDYAEPVAADFPECLEIVERLVKPARDLDNRKARRDRWWQFAERSPGLYESIAQSSRVLVGCRVSKFVSHAWTSTAKIIDITVNAIVSESDTISALLQSSFYDYWVREYASSLETRVRYTLTDCFETFPFPSDLSGLENIGEHYHNYRSQLMHARNEGLTKIYNRFHDPRETASDVAKLRFLHRELDIAVALAFGWADLAANDGATLGHSFHETKQGFRFTLALSTRREALDRLLALNHQRHAEEVASSLHDKKPRIRPKLAPAAAPVPTTQEMDFGAPATIPAQDAAVFALPLIPYLLSEASRAKLLLRMTSLKRAFDFITNPVLMEAAAKPADERAVKAWSTSWRSPVGPEWFINTLRRLAGTTVRATTDEDDPPMALVVAPTQPDSPQLREGIRLAVLVAYSAGSPPPEEKAVLVRERHSIFTTV